MDKRIIIGLVAGLVFGLIQMFIPFFQYGATGLILNAILGGLIGFGSTKMSVAGSYYATSAVIGVLFYLYLAFSRDGGLDAIVTGAVVGVLIGFLARLIGDKVG